MKINKDYMLRQIADTWVVLPLGEATLDFNGMMTLNETGSFLWIQLEKGCTREELLQAMLSEYDVSYDEAERDIDIFLEKLKAAGCLE